jgi:hypothetical protein
LRVAVTLTPGAGQCRPAPSLETVMANENLNTRRDREQRTNMVRRCKTVGELFRAVFGRPVYCHPMLGPDEALMNLSIETGVGESCARTVLAAQQFIKAGLPDYELTRVKKNLADAVIAQLETYYFG